ncbi:NH(3)-dependent NAD(+) synthetase [Buchnera aphidicola (Eriosoma grossulariae)]|uniref:ammonia-dependent NAD(+) synthetase n=1 Tax=Buchnera aphidicola TaxID=9 RepID=UPI003463C9AD
MNLQKYIIKLLNVKPVINSKKEIQKCINLIELYLNQNPKIKTLVVGISGGQDSTLTGKLCQMAIQKIRTKKNDLSYNLIAVRMPYGIQNDEKDCQDALKYIQPNYTYTINIQDTILMSELSLKKSGITISDYVRGNQKSRERMKIQYSIASMYQGIVVGTGHAAEYITGFFTKFGDGASDINPIARFNKKQGKKLLQTLNCPSHLYLKDPKPDLEDEKPNQTDEEILKITYNDIDDYLEGKNINKISKKKIESLYNQTKHKRMMPITKINQFLLK